MEVFSLCSQLQWDCFPSQRWLCTADEMMGVHGLFFKTERHYPRERAGGFLSWLQASGPCHLIRGRS